MTLTDRQRSIDGYVIGKPAPWGIVSEDGLEDLEVRDGDRLIPRDDGSIPGIHLSGSRTVVLQVVTTGDRETVEGNMEDLEAATVPQRERELEYRFKNPHRPERFVRVRPVRRRRPRTAESEHGPLFVTLALKAADPRIYSVEQFSTLVDIFESTGGGFNLPVAELPLNMTEASQALAVANNAGSRDAYPLIRFQFPSGGSGTCEGVQLENLTNGDLLDVDTTLVAGQTLTADMDALIRRAKGPYIHIDGASRYGDWVPPRDDFRLSSGDNTLKFEVTGTSTDVVCLVTWHNTD